MGPIPIWGLVGLSQHHTPHESTKEKPSFLLFGIDLKSPTEACFLPPDSLDPTDLSSYQEELILSLSAAREMAVASVKEAQKNYKKQYDKKSTVIDYKLGDWVFVHFPEEETGKKRKISRPWYGPFRVVARRDPNLTVTKVYFPEDTPIEIHQLRVCPSPNALPAGFYWYGARRWSPGRTPNWLQRMLAMTNGENVRNSPQKVAHDAGESGTAVADVTDEQEVPCPENLEAQEPQLGTNDMMLEDTDSGLALPDGSEDQEKNTDSESGANSEVSPTRANTRYPLRDRSK